MDRHSFEQFNSAEDEHRQERFHRGSAGGRRCGNEQHGHGERRREFARILEALRQDWQQGFRDQERQAFGHGGCQARVEARGRHGFEGGWGGRGRGRFGGPGSFEGGFGRGRGRMFDSGDFKLVVLKLLSEQPRYGYQLIKTMEERLAGGYTPSAGVIYPTLTLLEEEGLATATVENGRKVYAITPEGAQFLEANKPQIDELFRRMEEAGRHFKRERHPEVVEAFMNLRGAVVARASRGKLTKEQLAKIVDAINTAAKTIDEF